MKPASIALRLSLLFLVLLVAAFLAVLLFSHHSPTVDVLGSYFPAWMVCMVSGVALTLIAHWLVQSRHWQPFVGPAPLIYTCLWFIFTFATWILFYQN